MRIFDKCSVWAIYLVISLLVPAVLCCGAIAAPGNMHPHAADASEGPGFSLHSFLTHFAATSPKFYIIRSLDAWVALQKAPKPFVLDVRDASEINHKIEGAVNIPLRSLMKNLDQLHGVKQPILVYSNIGNRSAIGVAVLQMLGYRKARSILNGLNLWVAAGFPVSDRGVAGARRHGSVPQVNALLIKHLDQFLRKMPDDFYAIPPVSAAQVLSSDTKPFLIGLRMDIPKAAGHIGVGEVNIPLPKLLVSLRKLPSDKAGPILIYCKTGTASAIEVTLLRLLGRTNVYSIRGGFDNWLAAGLPVIKK